MEIFASSVVTNAPAIYSAWRAGKQSPAESYNYGNYGGGSRMSEARGGGSSSRAAGTITPKTQDSGRPGSDTERGILVVNEFEVKSDPERD